MSTTTAYTEPSSMLAIGRGREGGVMRPTENRYTGWPLALLGLVLFVMLTLPGGDALAEPWRSTNSLPTTSGTYELQGNVTLSSTWSAPGSPSRTTTIDLNGYGIILTGTNTIINVRMGTTLNLIDSSNTTHHYTISNGIATVDESGSESFSGGYITGGNRTGRYNGGAIISSGNLNCTGITFIGNRTQQRGGAIYAEDSITTINSCSFLYNSSGTDSNNRGGGAIAVVSQVGGSKLSVTDSVFQGNTGTYGGAIEAQGSGNNSITINNSKFVSNTARKGGGAININKNFEFTIMGGLFDSNAAGKDGGAIRNSGELTIDGDSRFTKNVADTYGGAIHTFSDSDKEASLTLADVEIAGGNQAKGIGVAKGKGGGVYFESGKLYLEGSPKISGNLGYTGLANNLAIDTGKGYRVNFSGIITGSEKIGVSLYNADSKKDPRVAGVFTSGLPQYGDITYFFSDKDIFYVLPTSENEAKLGINKGIYVVKEGNGTLTVKYADSEKEIKDKDTNYDVTNSPTLIIDAVADDYYETAFFGYIQLDDDKLVVEEFKENHAFFKTTKNTIIVAIFSPIVYTITLDCNGGSLEEGIPAKFEYTYESDDMLPTPTRDGYTFDGWEVVEPYSDGTWKTKGTLPHKNGENTYKLSKDWGNVTLRAKWVENKNPNKPDDKKSDDKGSSTSTKKRKPTSKWSTIAGANRYLTMADVVRAAFTSSEWAVLASGEVFPDALTASSVAGALQCPIVTTTASALSDDARAVLTSLGVTNVLVVGGESSVSPEVMASLADMGIEAARVSGADRIMTSIAVLSHLRAMGEVSDTVIIATGSTFADALSVGPVSYAGRVPIILVNGTVSEEALQAISDGGFTKAVILGGASSVSPEVEGQLEGLQVERIAGADRYQTSAAIATFATRFGLGFARPVVASGENFADALIGAPLAARQGGVLLLVADSSTAAEDLLRQHRSEFVSGTVLGGEASVSAALIARLEAAVA